MIAQPQTHTTKAHLWRMSVGRYHRMIQAGILTDDDPVELLEGLWKLVKFL